jgi:hypothetical protein
VFAEANTSAGAPSLIWAASASEPANEYCGLLSILGNTSVSDAAARTLIVAFGPRGAAEVEPIASSASAATTAIARSARLAVPLLSLIVPP